MKESIKIELFKGLINLESENFGRKGLIALICILVFI